MGAHINIDPDARTIELITAPTGGLVTLEMRRDIYSEAKEDWLTDASLRKLRFPLRDPITAFVKGVQIGPFVFVDNASGWRILPYDANHELTINGDFLAIDDDIPLFLPRASRTILISLVLSARTQTALVSGNAPWTSGELAQIRYRLGVDGTKAAPVSDSSLVDEIWDEDMASHTIAGSAGLLLSALARLPGLMRENTYMDETVYDTDVNGNEQLREARLRCFDTKEHAEAATEGGSETDGLIATYTISAAWKGPGQMEDYRMILEP